jgi:release factor glutamine methyltransferase
LITVFSAVNEGIALLKRNNVDTPRLDCEVIMAFVLGTERIKILTEGSRPLEASQYERFISLAGRRACGEPTAYLTGRREFMSLDFAVGPGVLIPRGDTETLVLEIIEECKSRTSPVLVADIGCGSGAIGISIARYVPKAMVTMIDISPSAVETATGNALLNDVKDRVRIMQGNLLEPLADERFDIIVSNPPYIETGEIPSLQREVRDFEPRIALDGGPDGLDFYRHITSEAGACLKGGGLLGYEIGYNQAEAVSRILADNGFEDIKLYKDLAGYDRCITARILSPRH